MNFETFNLHPSVIAGVQDMGYIEPTPIQHRSIPLIMQGRDLIGLAQTGTGKTAAFALPLLQRLLAGPSGTVRALIISPTRELAEQTCQTINGLGEKTGLQSIAIYGGVSMEQQTQILRSGIDIVAACPGRLLDHLWQGTIDLSNLEVLVIDEADRMFDMGFLPDIRGVLQCILHRRQTLLFSATMPDDIRCLVREILHDPVTVQIGHTVPVATVSHVLYPVKQHLKTALLKAILRKTKMESVLIFTRTKHTTNRVAQQLQRVGFRVTSLQGDLPQYRRQEALEGFRAGWFKILVATDIASRGIDVLSISHVINYDMPKTVDDFIHRIGRTGRVNKNGTALTFVTKADAPMVKAIERVLKGTLECRRFKGFNYAQTSTISENPEASRRLREHTGKIKQLSKNKR